MADRVWEGAGFDGKPVALYVSSHRRPSRNMKTGWMVQTWIMRRRVDPLTALKKRDDGAVCGDCTLRSGHGCYVNVSRAPKAVWKSGNARELVDPAEVLNETYPFVPVRIGAYGDPAVVPIGVWRKLLGTRKWTGYTARWRRTKTFASLVMASVQSSEQRAEAKSRGYRTFRILAKKEDIEQGEILCPASKEMGHRTVCATCLLCNGSRGPDDKRKDIAIVAHGQSVRRVLQMLSQQTLALE